MEQSFLSHIGTTILALILIFALVDTAAADADLEPSYARISGGWPDDDTFHPGDDIRIRLRVTNIGDEISDNFTVYYYIDGYSLGSESFSSLAPGEFNGFCYGHFTLPSEIPYGEYSVRVEVSCSNDTNPDNNEDSGDRSFIYAEKPLSDLEALDVSDADAPADGIYHPGEGIKLTAQVINHSDENSNDFAIEFYVGGYNVGSASPFGLDPGETYNRSHVFSLPSDIPDGNHTLRIEISCPNDGTPNNNESVGGEITVAEKGPPDLYFTNFTASSGPFYAGHPATFICRIENAGHSTSDTYTLDFYIGGDNVGSEDCSGIEEHGEEWFNTTITLPHNLPAGVHDINVEISCPDDLDSGNNSASTQLTVGESALPEISTQSVEATEGIYKPGDSITVRIRIECGDGQLGGDMEVDFYASADTEISSGDYKIKNAGFGNLEPGESYTFDTTCRFPSHLPDGYYYIGTIVTYPDTGDVVYDQHAVWVSEPMDPAAQTVRATAGTYSPGDEIKVYSLVKNIGERASERYSVDYYLSTDTTITTADYKIGYVERGPLAPGQQHSFNTFCRLPLNVPAGDCYIGIIITFPKDYDTTNNVGRGSATVEVVHPAGYVCGRATYQDKRNRKQPIRYALVEVHAEDNNNDPLDDPLLGQTHTNGEGLYGLVLANDGNSGRDIYVKVISEGVSGAYPGTTSRICTLKDAVLDEVYALVSDPHPHPRNSSAVIDLMSPRFEGGEFMVFDSIVEGFTKAKTFLNIELDELRAYWPGEAKVSYFDPDTMEIYISQDDRGDRDVIMHEYAHFIADVYGVAQGQVGDDSTHYWDQDLRSVPSNRTDEQAMNLAFREAWPTWFSIAAQYGDTGYPYSGDSIYDDEDEEGSWTLRVDLDVDGNTDFWPGQYFENMNAAALWDIFDDKNDGAGGGDTLSDLSLEKIWTISRDYKIENILDLWDNWFKKYDYKEEMSYIFKIHELPHEKPPPQSPEPSTNRPPVADAGEDITVYQTSANGATVTLSGENSYDPDGDEITSFHWRAGWVQGTGPVKEWEFPPGERSVTLTVSDGKLEAEDEIVVTVIPTDPSTWN